MSGLKMLIFSAQKKKKLDLAKGNILHNILEQPIFLTVILIGSLHMPNWIATLRAFETANSSTIF